MQKVRRAGAALGGAFSEFFADGCPKLAAAISYYALLALFPLAILLVALASFVLDDEAARSRIIEAILGRIPLRVDEGRAELEELLRTVTQSAPATGAVGLLFLILSSSGVMGAVRFALNTVWDVDDPRPPLPGKALDVVLVLLAGVVVATSLTLTFVVREISEVSEQTLGSVGAAIGDLVLVLGRLLPGLLGLVTFTLLFRYIPATPVRLRHALAGGLFAAAGYEATKTLFAFYLENIATLSAVYASLGTVVAFLVFVWLTANVFLFGAELAQQLPYQTGEADVDAEPLGRRLVGALRGLVIRPPTRHGELEGSTREERPLEPRG